MRDVGDWLAEALAGFAAAAPVPDEQELGREWKPGEKREAVSARMRMRYALAMLDAYVEALPRVARLAGEVERKFYGDPPARPVRPKLQFERSE